MCIIAPDPARARCISYVMTPNRRTPPKFSRVILLLTCGVIVLALSYSIGTLAPSVWHGASKPPTDAPAQTTSNPEIYTSQNNESGSGSLARAQQLIASALTSSNQLEKAQAVGALSDLVKATDSPQRSIEAIIDRLDGATISKVLINYVGFQPVDFGSITNLHAFSKRLASFAMDGTLNEPEPAPKVPTTAFSNISSSDPSISVPKFTDFPAGSRKIYATIPLVSYDRNSVVAKWYRKDNPTLFTMTRHGYTRGRDSLDIWLVKEGGLPGGSYVLEVLSIEDSPRVLSRAEFSVREHN